MFRSKTVFVVGAGASCELGFPSGSEILAEIAEALDIRFNDGRNMDRGDPRIYHAFQQLSRQNDGLPIPINGFQFAGWKVRDAAQLGLSIDNVISQFADDEIVGQVSKIAIVRQILKAEQRSKLSIPRDRIDGLDLGPIRNTWLGGFAQLLVQDKGRSSLGNIFENISVISFNYDRSIRRFLPFALMSQFGMPENEAQQLAKILKIYYPYGSVGALQWEGTGTFVAYGDADHAPLVEISHNIRTFNEQIEDGGELSDMRFALANASRVVFLGFGYHRQNMVLLSDGIEGSASRVFGTAVGLSTSDEEVVIGQLQQFLATRFVGHFDPILAQVNCAKFIQEYFRALTA